MILFQNYVRHFRTPIKMETPTNLNVEIREEEEMETFANLNVEMQVEAIPEKNVSIGPNPSTPPNHRSMVAQAAGFSYGSQW
jgi:hypothetical protein